MKDLKKVFQPSILICLLFFIAYSVLSIVRHLHYGSFGADLGFIDHLVWRYSNFYPFAVGSHLEIIFVLLSPFYWLLSDPIMLLVLQAFAVTFSGIPIFLLAKEKKLHPWLWYALLLSYLTFFGVQNALWFDVHSSAFGAAFMAWFIYFLVKGNTKLAILFFLLSIGSKENIAGYTFLISSVYFLISRQRLSLIFAIISLFYIFILFGLYFPSVQPKGYGYASEEGLVSGNIIQLIDSQQKRATIFYAFAWVGFLPVLAPLYAIPVLGNLASYFILGRGYVAAHEIFMHYRIDLAPLLLFATIFTIARYKLLNNKYIAVYLLLCALFFQYTLHLPLSYLSKQWFWTRPSGVDNINRLIQEIPKDSSVVAQNNIYPHLSQRENILLLWPDKKSFTSNSPCGEIECPWFRWEKPAELLIVDISPEWDIRHLLQNREDYISAINNLEKTGVISKVEQVGSTSLYKIRKMPK